MVILFNNFIGTRVLVGSTRNWRVSIQVFRVARRRRQRLLHCMELVGVVILVVHGWHVGATAWVTQHHRAPTVKAVGGLLLHVLPIVRWAQRGLVSGLVQVGNERILA